MALDLKGVQRGASIPIATGDDMTVERRGEYLGTRATHHDGELVGITLALQLHRHWNLPFSIHHRNKNTELPGREGTYVVWVKGHKDIKGNEEADRISRETSILCHETGEVLSIVLYCIVLYLLPVLNPKSYDGARVLEASVLPMLVIGRK